MPWGPVGKRVMRVLQDLMPWIAAGCFSMLKSTWALEKLLGGNSRKVSEASQEDRSKIPCAMTHCPRIEQSCEPCSGLRTSCLQKYSLGGQREAPDT